MIIEPGECVHVVTRRLFEGDIRRHFVGRILATEGSLVRGEGYTFVFDPHHDDYHRHDEKRTRVLDLGSEAHIVNILPRETDLDKLDYTYTRERRLVISEGDRTLLDINEFGVGR